MTEEELKKLVSERNQEIANKYPAKAMELLMEVYEQGINLGMEIGKNFSRKWTRTSEQLPEIDEAIVIHPGYYQSREVLIDIPGGALAIARYIHKQDGTYCWRADGDYEYLPGLVLHWMELPEYPKYIKNEEEQP